MCLQRSRSDCTCFVFAGMNVFGILQVPRLFVAITPCFTNANVCFYFRHDLSDEHSRILLHSYP